MVRLGDVVCAARVTQTERQDFAGRPIDRVELEPIGSRPSAVAGALGVDLGEGGAVHETLDDLPPVADLIGVLGELVADSWAVVSPLSLRAVLRLGGAGIRWVTDQPPRGRPPECGVSVGQGELPSSSAVTARDALLLALPPGLDAASIGDVAGAAELLRVPSGSRVRAVKLWAGLADDLDEIDEAAVVWLVGRAASGVADQLRPVVADAVFERRCAALPDRARALWTTLALGQDWTRLDSHPEDWDLLSPFLSRLTNELLREVLGYGSEAARSAVVHHLGRTQPERARLRWFLGASDAEAGDGVFPVDLAPFLACLDPSRVLAASHRRESLREIVKAVGDHPSARLTLVQLLVGADPGETDLVEVIVEAAVFSPRERRWLRAALLAGPSAADPGWSISERLVLLRGGVLDPVRDVFVPLLRRVDDWGFTEDGAALIDATRRALGDVPPSRVPRRPTGHAGAPESAAEMVRGLPGWEAWDPER